jgi:hypothetical protein
MEYCKSGFGRSPLILDQEQIQIISDGPQYNEGIPIYQFTLDSRLKY